MEISDIEKDRERTFPSGRSDCHAISGLEKLGVGNGVVNLRFEDCEEALLAYLLPSLRAPQDCLRILAEGTALWCHGRESVTTNNDVPPTSEFR
jgi:hypothetical protein